MTTSIFICEFPKLSDNLVRTKPFKANILLKAFATMFMGLISIAAVS